MSAQLLIGSFLYLSSQNLEFTGSQSYWSPSVSTWPNGSFSIALNDNSTITSQAFSWNLEHITPLTEINKETLELNRLLISSDKILPLKRPGQTNFLDARTHLRYYIHLDTYNPTIITHSSGYIFLN